MPSAITVTELWHYPIKSCRGIRLDRALVGPRGIINDRGWMIVEPNGMFITQREHPRLALITPSFQNNHLYMGAPGIEVLAVPVNSEGAKIEVTVWRDQCSAIDQGDWVAEWLGDFLGIECRLVRMADDWVRQVDPIYAQPGERVGFADAFPLLLASESSLANLNRRLDQALPMNCFRPNIVIQGASPFDEDRWDAIRIGAMTMRVAKPCARCVMTTVDQLRGVVDGSEPLLTLATFRKQNGKVMFAQNVLHDGEGVLAIGDQLEVLTRG